MNDIILTVENFGLTIKNRKVNIVGSQVFSGPFFAGNQYWGGNEAVFLDQIPCG